MTLAEYEARQKHGQGQGNSMQSDEELARQLQAWLWHLQCVLSSTAGPEGACPIYNSEAPQQEKAKL